MKRCLLGIERWEHALLARNRGDAAEEHELVAEDHALMHRACIASPGQESELGRRPVGQEYRPPRAGLGQPILPESLDGIEGVAEYEAGISGRLRVELVHAGLEHRRAEREVGADRHAVDRGAVVRHQAAEEVERISVEHARVVGALDQRLGERRERPQRPVGVDDRALRGDAAVRARAAEDVQGVADHRAAVTFASEHQLDIGDDRPRRAPRHCRRGLELGGAVKALAGASDDNLEGGSKVRADAVRSLSSKPLQAPTEGEPCETRIDNPVCDTIRPRGA